MLVKNNMGEFLRLLFFEGVRLKARSLFAKQVFIVGTYIVNLADCMQENNMEA